MKSLYIIGILLTIIIGSFFNWVLCCDVVTEEVEIDEVIVVEEKAPVINPLIIIDSTGSFNYEANDNFNFNASDFIILRPLEQGVEDGVMQLKEYVGNDASKFVNVTGYYENSETNNSAFPNLGLARANAVKNHLIAQGISSKKINTFGELQDGLPKQDSIYVGPVSFLITNDANVKDAELIVKNIKENPIVLYFDTGKSTISLSEEQRLKYQDIVRAMDKVDDVSVLIVGHTDNTGNAEQNMVLGKNRAEFIKAYLVKNGIPSEEIVTVSKGQEQPIATNDTEEGRAENRRTVITIK
ncbi:OmpA family protein [Galbibacter sp. PAP.153]|uniref:OmpA family protein n=1 Tax=Galbibacter sp. PAP.153 TaxID=3104623 RepID=UPI0030090E34